MTISELINELEKIKKENGDVIVVMEIDYLVEYVKSCEMVEDILGNKQVTLSAN